MDATGVEGKSNFEARGEIASGKRKKRKVDSLSHSESQHEKETYKVEMKIQGLKEGAGGVSLSKHTVARWIKNKVGDVKLIDSKRSGLIVQCISETQMVKALKVLVSGSQMDVCPVACFLLSKTAPIKDVVDGVSLKLDARGFKE